MAARLAVGETRPPGERPGLGTSMEPAALAWSPNQLALDPPAAAMVKMRGSDSALAALRRGRSGELTIVRADSRIVNERKGNQ